MVCNNHLFAISISKNIIELLIKIGKIICDINSSIMHFQYTIPNY